MTVKNLQKYYVITSSERELNEEQLKLKQKELDYINDEVIPKRDVMREK